jgi:aryl-alcohol dehydrogenase-like predicted oxidoreductase
MEMVNFKSIGVPMSQCAFGTALTVGVEYSDLSSVSSLIEAAWEQGIRVFDTSNNYGGGLTELKLGEALGNYERSQYILKSKVGWQLDGDIFSGGLSRKHIRAQIADSLTRLNTNFIDIYYAHRFDERTPLEETVETFSSLVSQGKINYWGTSQWSLEQLSETYELCEKHGYLPPVAEQFIFNPIIKDVFDNGVYKLLSDRGVARVGFSPLCQGILSGKYRGGNIPPGSRISKADSIGYDKTRLIMEQHRDVVAAYFECCDDNNIDPAVTALRWIISKNVVPIIGASKPSQMKLITDALSSGPLPSDIELQIDNIKRSQ